MKPKTKKSFGTDIQMGLDFNSCFYYFTSITLDFYIIYFTCF